MWEKTKYKSVNTFREENISKYNSVRPEFVNTQLTFYWYFGWSTQMCQKEKLGQKSTENPGQW